MRIHNKEKLLDDLTRALHEAKLYLEKKNQAVDYHELHQLKSKLYVAIERVGLRAERIVYAQRLLRELFAIVNTLADLRDHERQTGLQIIDEISERWG